LEDFKCNIPGLTHLAIGNSGDVGVWHETYLVNKNCDESLYINMPRFGLAKAGKQVDLNKTVRNKSNK